MPHLRGKYESNEEQLRPRGLCKLFVYYAHWDPLWQAEEAGRWSLERVKGWWDCWPRGRTTGLQRQHKNDDMKELLIALGSHTSDADCQTGCEGYSEHSLVHVCCFSNVLRTHRPTVSPATARSGSNILCSALKMSGKILTVSLVKCYCGFTFRTN